MCPPSPGQPCNSQNPVRIGLKTIQTWYAILTVERFDILIYAAGIPAMSVSHFTLTLIVGNCCKFQILGIEVQQ